MQASASRPEANFENSGAAIPTSAATFLPRHSISLQYHWDGSSAQRGRDPALLRDHLHSGNWNARNLRPETDHVRIGIHMHVGKPRQAVEGPRDGAADEADVLGDLPAAAINRENARVARLAA
jgi:hypothetical protein